MKKLMSRIQWQNRQAMVERGATVFHAHWKGKLESEAFQQWFAKNIHRYAKVWFGNVRDNWPLVEAKFWYDAERYLVEHYYQTDWADYLERGLS